MTSELSLVLPMSSLWRNPIDYGPIRYTYWFANEKRVFRRLESLETFEGLQSRITLQGFNLRESVELGRAALTW